MTDLAVQKQSQAPAYGIGGAVIGGAAGAGLAKYANIGLTGKYADSWEKAVEEVNKDDAFVKKMAGKENENAKNWKVLQEQAEEIKKAEEALGKALPEGFEAKAELEDLVAKSDALETAENALKDAETKKTLDIYNKELAEVKKAKTYEIQDALKNGIADDVADDSVVKTIKGMTSTDGKVVLDEANLEKLLKSENEADKAFVKTLVEDRQGFKDEIAKIDLAKEKEAVTKAQEAVTKAEEALVKKDTKNLFKDDVKKAYSEAVANVKKAKNTAKEKLTDEVMGALKKPKVMLTAAIGAVALGLVAALAAPKKEV